MKTSMQSRSAVGTESELGALRAVPRDGAASGGGYAGAVLAASLLRRVFQHVPGVVYLRLWDGTPVLAGSGSSQAVLQGEPPYELVFRNPEAVYSLVLARDPLRVAEAYFSGELDIEGDLFQALALKDHLDALQLPFGERLSAAYDALKLRSLNSRTRQRAVAVPVHGNMVRAHSKSENKAAIAFHYDVSNDFYALWLDRAMVYSCAYFQSAEQDLDGAQAAKLEHICRKLMLKSEERFLDIGCGWGALVIHAARHYGVRAHGVTLSRRQLEVAQQRIREAGLEKRVTVELMDYRDLPGEAVYDKIASVGMFEHVGLKNLPVYFATVQRLLKAGGLFLNHGITHEAEGWSHNVSTEFINRYVFPDGQLDTVSNIQRHMEQAKFEITDVEALRAHYAMTLRHWVARLEANHEKALQFVNEATYRVWRLYMAACAMQFEAGDIGIYQVLASKRAGTVAALPLTRKHLYVDASRSASA